VVGRKTPGFAPLAPAPAAPDRHRTKAALEGPFMFMAQPAKFIAAHRTDRRALIRFPLGGFFQEFAFHSLSLLEDLSLQIAHRLVLVRDAPV
jgi:hypothetical protein